MPGFGAAAAALNQACGAPEWNSPAAPTCFFPGLRRTSGASQKQRRQPEAAAQARTSGASQEKSALQCSGLRILFILL
jgi:hypothetical protein